MDERTPVARWPWRHWFTPQEAICDIVDNAVSAGAANVYIKSGKLDEGLNDNRRNNVREYLIIDDGKGMTENEMGKALDLGSDDSLYAPGAPFKFGLGLKSASFANGNRLELISGVAGMFHKEYVDLDETEDEYFSCVTDLNDQDRQLVETYLCDDHGTIVRVAKIRNPEHPSSSAIDDLKRKLGVIYYSSSRRTVFACICSTPQTRPPAPSSLSTRSSWTRFRRVPCSTRTTGG